jgi:hypothetical protein
MPAFRLSAPIVRFISFDISTTGVLRFGGGSPITPVG